MSPIAEQISNQALTSPCIKEQEDKVEVISGREMSQFFGKILTWIANEVVVKTLANNKTFQRFALRTDTFARENYSKAKDTISKTVKEGTIPPIVGGGASNVQTIRDQIDKMNIEIKELQKKGSFDKVAELTYVKLPELEIQLKEAEKGFVEKNYSSLVEHLFAKDDIEENGNKTKKNGESDDEYKKNKQKI